MSEPLGVDAATLLKERASSPEAQSLRLTVIAGPDVGATATIAQRAVLVGRAGAAEFRLTDPMVSAFHVELAWGERGIALRDLDSLNGTFYGGVRLGTAVLPPGVVLELGESLVRVAADARFRLPTHDVVVFGELRGASVRMRELFFTLSKLARTDLSILIEGATGTGKELAARAVHDASEYGGGPFVAVDCTAIPPTLAASVLFGHERGAFTDAREARPGVFEAADGGTLFLDEVGDLPPDVQPMLLRVLERREVVRVGSTRPRPVRVRVVSATWRDVRALVNKGHFREDLYYRLAQARVAIPPLADRPDDVPLLVAHFLEAHAARGRGALAIAPEALAELARRDYRGNVRELKNVVERVAALAEGPVISAADLAFERMLSGSRRATPPPRAAAGTANGGGPPGPDPADPMTPFKDAKRTAIDEFERGYLERLLARAGNNLTRAATLSQVERHHLRDLCRKHGLRGTDG